MRSTPAGTTGGVLAAVRAQLVTVTARERTGGVPAALTHGTGMCTAAVLGEQTATVDRVRAVGAHVAVFGSVSVAALVISHVGGWRRLSVTAQMLPGVVHQQATGSGPVRAPPTAVRQAPGGVAEAMSGRGGDRVSTVAAHNAPVPRRRRLVRRRRV